MTKLKYIYFVFIFFGIISIANSQILKQHRDSLDGAIDLSHFLKDLNGVLPVVSPITEPAVGFGAAVAGLYFIAKEENEEKTYQAPDIATIAGGFTENGTWFAGAGYIGFWKNDNLRYRGAVGYGDINLEYFRRDDTPLLKKSEEFNISGFLFLQQAVFRIANTNFFAGGNYKLSHANVSFIKDPDLPDIDLRDFDVWNSGITAIAEYEKLDNVFSPNKGMRIHLSYEQNLELIGSDRNWGTIDFFANLFFPVSKTWVPSFRLASSFTTGDIPFFAKPYIELRGIPAMRYQGDLTLSLETEQMVNITPRWSLVGFGGMGNTYESFNDYKAEEFVWNAGGGFRYLVARLFGLKMGLDVARGPEDWAVYVVFGSAWLR